MFCWIVYAVDDLKKKKPVFTVVSWFIDSIFIFEQKLQIHMETFLFFLFTCCGFCRRFFLFFLPFLCRARASNPKYTILVIISVLLKIIYIVNVYFYFYHSFHTWNLVTIWCYSLCIHEKDDKLNLQIVFIVARISVWEINKFWN